MQAIKIKAKSHGRTLTLQVPQQFDNKELEVLVYINDNDANDSAALESLTNKNRLKEMMSIVGSAKYPDFHIEKYDTYDQ